MNIFGNLTKNITNLLGGNNPDSLYRQNFINKTHEELVDIASTFADENHIIKEQINTLMKENELLKNSIISNGSAKSSTFGKFYKDMKNTLLNIDDESAKEEGDGFKQFLYDQFLFYGGLEEEDIHNLNQMNFSDAEWEKSREIYMFKQNILERNYHELFRNLAISKEINKFMALDNKNSSIYVKNVQNEGDIEQKSQNTKEKVLKNMPVLGIKNNERYNEDNESENNRSNFNYNSSDFYYDSNNNKKSTSDHNDNNIKIINQNISNSDNNNSSNNSINNNTISITNTTIPPNINDNPTSNNTKTLNTTNPPSLKSSSLLNASPVKGSSSTGSDSRVQHIKLSGPKKQNKKISPIISDVTNEEILKIASRKMQENQLNDLLENDDESSGENEEKKVKRMKRKKNKKNDE